MEVLVRIVDRSAREDDSKRGDIVCVQPDGWAWSQEELTNDFWLILSISSLLNTDRDTMLSQRPDRSPGGRWRRREWTIDFSVLPLPNRFAFPRTQAKVNMTRVGFIAALKRKQDLT